jgi:hypothetical protein
MFNHNAVDKPPQRTIIHYVVQMALDQITTLSDSLIAIQPSKNEVEKDTIADLAFLIREKTEDIKDLLEEISKENRSIGLG